jgi:hypothetical protein
LAIRTEVEREKARVVVEATNPAAVVLATLGANAEAVWESVSKAVESMVIEVFILF